MDLPDPNATLTYERIVELQNDLNERRRRALAYQLSRDDKAAVIAHFSTLQHQLDVADRARKSAISEQGRTDRKGMGIDAQAERDAARRAAGGGAGAPRGAAKGTEEAQSAKDGKSRIHDLTDMTFGEWGNQKKYGQVVSGNQRYLYARDDLGPDGKPTAGALPVNQIPESDWQDIVSSTFDRANRTLPQPIPADGEAPPVPGARLAPYSVQPLTRGLLAGIAPSRNVGPVYAAAPSAPGGSGIIPRLGEPTARVIAPWELDSGEAGSMGTSEQIAGSRLLAAREKFRQLSQPDTPQPAMDAMGNLTGGYTTAAEDAAVNARPSGILAGLAAKMAPGFNRLSDFLASEFGPDIAVAGDGPESYLPYGVDPDSEYGKRLRLLKAAEYKAENDAGFTTSDGAKVKPRGR